MKPFIYIALVMLVLIGGVLFITRKQMGFPQPDKEQKELQNQNISLPATCVDQPETRAVITGISQTSGTANTTFTLSGCNFAGFEGDLKAWIVNDKGQKGLLVGSVGSTAKKLLLTLQPLLCEEDTSYSGNPCPSELTLAAGTYSIFVAPWGDETKSNAVPFVIQ